MCNVNNFAAKALSMEKTKTLSFPLLSGESRDIYGNKCTVLKATNFNRPISLYCININNFPSSKLGSGA